MKRTDRRATTIGLRLRACELKGLDKARLRGPRGSQLRETRSDCIRRLLLPILGVAETDSIAESENSTAKATVNETPNEPMANEVKIDEHAA